MLPSISVVLCCHNSAERLPETLRHLSEQRVPAGLTWEILVIDNASTDNTPQLVQEFSTQHSQLSVRLITNQVGTGHARQRGMSEAAHDVILFVDDDNWLASDYVSILAETLREHPEISGLGGTSTALLRRTRTALASEISRLVCADQDARGPRIAPRRDIPMDRWRCFPAQCTRSRKRLWDCRCW